MSLLSKFISNIALVCGVPYYEIQIEDDKLSIGASDLQFFGVFFKNEQKHGTPGQCLEFFFSHYEEDPENTERVLHRTNPEISLNVAQLTSLNENIDPGIYEIQTEIGKNAIVFTGSFATPQSLPDFTSFPELLIAISLIEPRRSGDAINWTNIFEAIGPFVIFPTGIDPSLSISGCGLTMHQKGSFSFDWTSCIPPSISSRNPDVPPEAEIAYLSALHDSTTPDIAYLRLYRVLEILFAKAYKDEISQSGIAKIISLIQRFQSMSELDTLAMLLKRTQISLARFNSNDFLDLFSGHLPQGNYSKITSWINDTSTSGDRSDTVPLSHIIYYVRCSIVHSKMNEKEPFLIPPFSVKQKAALKKIVEDLKDIVMSLLC